MPAAVKLLPVELLPVEVNRLVLAPRNGSSNLRRRFAQLGLLVSKQALFGAGGALGAVQAFKAAPQAGMTQSAVTAAVAGQLVENVAHLGCILVDVHLPGIAEVISSQFGAGKNWRQRRNLQRCGGMIGRNILGRIRPLGIAHSGYSKDGKTK
jgi:hypothetical protein